MKIKSMEALLFHELKDLYSAENQLVKALPRMAKAAANRQLRKAFEEHLEETKNQVARLEHIFESLDVSPKGKKCKAMEGLIEEGKELLKEDADPEVLDAALIAAAQKVEHYEIAGYGCARTFARLLGEDEAARLLQTTLDEESRTDEKLTRLAEARVNPRAANTPPPADTPAEDVPEVEAEMSEEMSIISPEGETTEEERQTVAIAAETAEHPG